MNLIANIASLAKMEKFSSVIAFYLVSCGSYINTVGLSGCCPSKRRTAVEKRLQMEDEKCLTYLAS